MARSAPTISPTVANHVLFIFGEGGYQAGSFTTRLLATFLAADTQNFARLRTAFPDYGAALDTAQNDSNGIVKLRKIAAGQVAA